MINKLKIHTIHWMNKIEMKTNSCCPMRHHHIFHQRFKYLNCLFPLSTEYVCVHLSSLPLFLFFFYITCSMPLVIKAFDVDSGLNSLLHYDIVETMPRRYFHIDSTTGAIKTVMLLDHEKIPVFNFHVKVRKRSLHPHRVTYIFRIFFLLLRFLLRPLFRGLSRE